jgi:hypothetical protein
MRHTNPPAALIAGGFMIPIQILKGEKCDY